MLLFKAFALLSTILCITVVGLDADGVTLRLSGACHGCRFTDDTVRRVIEPAVGRVFPQMTVVVER